MKAKKSLDRLLRDALEKPRTLPPAEDFWQDFAARLEAGQSPAPPLGKKPIVWWTVSFLALAGLAGLSIWQFGQKGSPATIPSRLLEVSLPNAPKYKSAALPAQHAENIGKHNPATTAQPSPINISQTGPVSDKANAAKQTALHTAATNAAANTANENLKTPAGALAHNPLDTREMPHTTLPPDLGTAQSAMQETLSLQTPIVDIKENFTESALLASNTALRPLARPDLPAPTKTLCPIFGKREQWNTWLYVGTEPMGRFNYRSNATDHPSLGVGFQKTIYRDWRLKADLWWAQFDLPTLTFVAVNHVGVDAQRQTYYDSLVLHRVRRFALGVSAVKPWGPFMVSGGLSVGWNYQALQEKYTQVYDVHGNSNGSGYAFGNDAVPSDAVRQLYLGLRLGVEYPILNRWTVGVKTYQGLSDLTKAGKYSVANDWLVYLGYRMF